MIAEKLEFLLGPGGLRAAGYYCLKLIARVEAFNFVFAPTVSNGELVLPPEFHYLGIFSDRALANLPADLVGRVADQCGDNPQDLFRRGGSLHLMMSSNALAAQLTIDHGPTCRINSPPLVLTTAPTDAFLGYLYTWPPYRRQGAAGSLIAATVSDLSKHNIQRILAHVRATNVPSMAAFERAGWKICATILCSRGGRLLSAFGTKRAGLVLRSAAPVNSSEGE